MFIRSVYLLWVPVGGVNQQSSDEWVVQWQSIPTVVVAGLLHTTANLHPTTSETLLGHGVDKKAHLRLSVPPCLVSPTLEGPTGVSAKAIHLQLFCEFVTICRPILRANKNNADRSLLPWQIPPPGGVPSGWYGIASSVASGWACTKPQRCCTLHASGMTSTRMECGDTDGGTSSSGPRPSPTPALPLGLNQSRLETLRPSYRDT